MKLVHKIPNPASDPDEHSEEISKIFPERDVLGLEKSEPGTLQSAITPNKLFFGILVVLATLVIIYAITKIIS